MIIKAVPWYPPTAESSQGMPDRSLEKCSLEDHKKSTTTGKEYFSDDNKILVKIKNIKV